MKVERINMHTLAVEEKEKVRTIRVYSNGVITLSVGAAEHLGLSEGDRIELFVTKDGGVVEKIFISKSNHEKGFLLRSQKDGGLRLTNVNLTGMIINSIGWNEEQKSIRMGMYPQPHEFKEHNGYIAYQIHKK